MLGVFRDVKDKKKKYKKGVDFHWYLWYNINRTKEEVLKDDYKRRDR